ncbi:MAG TPA: flavin reductase family protein [Rhodospirillales bacterium]
MPFDSHKFRKALSHFATGVTIVTGRADDGEPVGVTVNAFCSVSLEPPLILICLAKTTGCLLAISTGDRFAVNVLSENQEDLSIEFAGPREHRFKNRAYDVSDGGCPILPGCLANLECTRTEVHEAGDHVIVVGRVERVVHATDGKPLLFYRSAYGRIDDA